MPKIKFANILKIRMKENAMLYLKEKQKSKGKEIIYTNIEMADYLQPINSKLTIEQKQQMFAVRNRTIFQNLKQKVDAFAVQLRT